MSEQTEGAALFSDAQGRLEAILERLGANDEVRRRLAQPVLSLEVAVPLRRDDAQRRDLQPEDLNVDELAAKVVLEIANGPVTSEADERLSERLSEREIVVMPDLLANTGGVIVSHLEWVQNRTGESISRKQRLIAGSTNE